MVKLRIPGREGFPRTTELMEGVDYCIRKAAELSIGEFERTTNLQLWKSYADWMRIYIENPAGRKLYCSGPCQKCNLCGSL